MEWIITKVFSVVNTNVIYFFKRDFEALAGRKVAAYQSTGGFMKVVWILTALSSLLGAVVFLISIAIGGVAQAAGFAAASALAVVPYVLAKCLQGIFEPSASDNAKFIVYAMRENKHN